MSAMDLSNLLFAHDAPDCPLLVYQRVTNINSRRGFFTLSTALLKTHTKLHVYIKSY